MITLYQYLYTGIRVEIRDSMGNFVYDEIVEKWDMSEEERK